MKKVVYSALAMVTTLLLSTPLVSAEEPTIGIVSVQPKDSITATRAIELSTSNDVYLVVDRSAYASDEYRSRVSKLVNELITSISDNDRIAIAYSNGRSSSVKLTHELTSNKDEIRKQLKEDESIVNSTHDEYPKYGDKNNLYSYIESLKDKSENSRVVYITDANDGQSAFAYDRYQLGALSTESVFSFVERMNLDVYPILLTDENAKAARQLKDHSIEPIIQNEFFGNHVKVDDVISSIVSGFKSSLYDKIVEVKTTSKLMTLNSVSVTDKDGKEKSLEVKENKVSSKLELPSSGKVTIKYQFSGTSEEDTVNVEVKTSRRAFIKEASQLKRNVSTVITL